MSARRLTGGCLCGAVRYEIAAEPIMAGFCHCLSCQKLSGAGRAMQVLVPKAALSIQGQTSAYRWTADSGNTVTTRFCPNCGSPLFGESNGMANAVAVRAVSLDDPSAVSPQMTVFTKRAQPWDHVETSLPTFPAMPPMPPIQG